MIVNLYAFFVLQKVSLEYYILYSVPNLDGKFSYSTYKALFGQYSLQELLDA